MRLHQVGRLRLREPDGGYEYLSYDFANRSADIRELFARVCDAVGVECRPAGDRVRIRRRGSVQLMRKHVGIKA